MPTPRSPAINLNDLRPTTRPTPEQVRQRHLNGQVAEMTLSQAGLDTLGVRPSATRTTSHYEAQAHTLSIRTLLVYALPLLGLFSYALPLSWHPRIYALFFVFSLSLSFAVMLAHFLDRRRTLTVTELLAFAGAGLFSRHLTQVVFSLPSDHLLPPAIALVFCFTALGCNGLQILYHRASSKTLINLSTVYVSFVCLGIGMHFFG